MRKPYILLLFTFILWIKSFKSNFDTIIVKNYIPFLRNPFKLTYFPLNIDQRRNNIGFEKQRNSQMPIQKIK